MNFRRHFFAVLTALLITTFARGADSTPQERFTEARIAFDQGDFSKARDLGEALVDEKNYSPALFQLLGNTRYRQGDIGHAALYYQRAALLPAPSAETRQNISHIHERTGNFYFPSNGIRQQFASWFSRAQWLTIAAACGWVLTFCCIIAFFFIRAGNLRALLLTIAVLALVGETSSILGWLWHPSFEKFHDIAVITAKEASAYSAASTTSKSLSPLPPGSQVRKIKDQGSWSYVEFHNENPPPEGKNIRGWIQTKSMTTLWPYDPACLE
ncbi:MAG: hypothetical protein K8R87_12505 [Verrucomicrobia bacterium]|nr:hypothetical protein [Verrucomicrobiota bacterium]